MSLRPVRHAIPISEEPAAEAGHHKATFPSRATRKPRDQALGIIECGAAFLVLLLWVGIFAGGILVDTEPYRIAISSSGAALLKDVPPATGAAAPASAATPESRTPVALPGQTRSWIVVMLCFLPLNLVWVCAASSALGAFGNRANLGTDQAAKRSRDNTNPYVSAILRGFFAYLFLTSGLLLLDDAPFSHPGPGQYIRLAGFLSLLCFVVSYQPRLFNTLIVWAFHRIEVREGAEGDHEEGGSDTLHAKKTTLEVTATHIAGPGAETKDHL
jgi:hypothetical protein